MKRLIFLFVFVSAALCGYAQMSEYERLVYYNADGDSLQYRLLLPENFDATAKQKYPLVVFLHGAGERGNDNELQLKHGANMFLNPVNREKYPAIVFFPQVPPDSRWIFPQRPAPGETHMSPQLKMAEEMIRQFIVELPVDERRIYVMGLSMGGIGTFGLVYMNPELFAAAVPICGAADNSLITPELKAVKFRIFHGDRDKTVEVRYSREAYLALKKAGVPVEYIEYPEMDHNSWDPAFNEPDFMEWVFKQKRK